MKKPEIIWLNFWVFAITGFIALLIVPAYAYWVGFSGMQVVAMVLGIAFCELSITAGYHRLWSHRAYQAHPVLRFIYALGGAYAIQNSILHWASDHRVHHLHVDNNEKDPYSAKKGFWYSHIGWMLRDYKVHDDKDYKNAADLKKDPVVMWQHKHYLALVLSLNFGIPLLLGVIEGDIIGMMLLAGVLRLVLSHHFTFFINSLAHIWGRQPYSDKNTARDNGFLAFLTMGEGYHNFHHAFQSDYRNGIRWWQYDPTKWLIKAMQYVKLASHLRKTPELHIEKSLAQTQLKNSLQKLANLPDREVLVQRLQQEYELLIQQINDFYQARKQWLESQKQVVKDNYDNSALAQSYHELKNALDQQKKNWQLLNARLA